MKVRRLPSSVVLVGLDGSRKGVMELQNIVFHKIHNSTVLGTACILYIIAVNDDIWKADNVNIFQLQRS